MGCMPSFHFKPKNFLDVISYCEKIDKRLGEILYVKMIDRKDSIMKRISKKEKQVFEERLVRCKEHFQSLSHFFYLINYFCDEGIEIQCSTNKGRVKFAYMNLDPFDKDLDDDIQIKSLKNRKYDSVEIWNIIYFSTFVFACLEENKLAIEIQRQNFLIVQQKLKYFYSDLFKEPSTP